jgi:hypothetical protein
VSPEQDQPATPKARQAQAAPSGPGRLWLETADGDLLGRRVSAWLAMHRINAGQLAQAAGTDRYGLSRALHGKRPFPLTLAVRICQYTGLDINGTSVTFDPRQARYAQPRDPRPAPPSPSPATAKERALT